MLGNWPSYDPANFSQLRPADPSSPSRMTPATLNPNSDRCVPPPNQVIGSEAKNILLRNLYKRAEDKKRSKRPASENLADQGAKNPRKSESSIKIEG